MRPLALPVAIVIISVFQGLRRCFGPKDSGPAAVPSSARSPVCWPCPSSGELGAAWASPSLVLVTTKQAGAQRGRVSSVSCPPAGEVQEARLSLSGDKDSSFQPARLTGFPRGLTQMNGS